MAGPLPDNASFFVQAEYPFTSPDGSALSFARGDVIEVLTQLESGWWDGLLAGGERGWFPSNYVRRITDDEAERWFVAQESGGVESERMLETSSLFYNPTASPDPSTAIPEPHTSNAEHGSLEADADFWIPSLTTDGQIYYRNTKTGQNAWEMPMIDGDDSSDGNEQVEGVRGERPPSSSAFHAPGNHDPTEELADIPSYSGQVPHPTTPGHATTLRIPPRGSSTLPPSSTAFSNGGPSRRMDSDHNLAGTLASSSTATTTAVPAAVGQTGSSTIPVPALGPPWELRMRSHNAGWYYFNTVTGDVKTDRAIQQQRERETQNKASHTPASAYEPAVTRNADAGTSGTAGGYMTRATSEPFNLAAAAATTSFSYPTNYASSRRSSSRSATPTPSTSRRPSTAGSGTGKSSRIVAGGLAEFAEDALRVFGIGIGKRAGRRSSKASFADKSSVGAQIQQQQQQQQQQQGLLGGLHTKHANSSIGGLSEGGRRRSRAGGEDFAAGSVSAGKRVSVGSIPARSSSRMSLSYYQQPPSQQHHQQSQGPQGRIDLAYGLEGASGGGNDAEIDTADKSPGLFWSGSGERAATRPAGRVRRIMQGQTTLDDHVSRLQAQLGLAAEAAERHLLALQTPEQTLTSLSLPDTPPPWATASTPTSSSAATTARVSQTHEARALKQQIDSLVPLVRELVYITRHAVLGLHTAILDTLPATATAANSARMAEHALSFLSSEELHHSQRRLVAALSKIIFFAHSAAGTDWPLGGTAERLALDTRDLAYAVEAYLAEVRVVGCMNEQVGQGLKRSFARFGSDDSDDEGQEERGELMVGPFGHPCDPARNERDWKLLDSDLERVLSQLVDSIQQSILALPRSTPPSGATPVPYNAAQHITDKLDEMFRFLCDLDILAVVDVDEDSLRDVTLDIEFNEYMITVTSAKAEFESYTHSVERLQRMAGDLLLSLIDQTPTGLGDNLSGMPPILDDLSKSVSSLLAISKRQAQLVPITLSPRIGAQSSSQAQRRQMTKLRNVTRSSSRRSSVISSALRPSTRYHASSAMPQDPSAFFPTSQSVTSYPGHNISGTGSLTAGSRMSASSSVSSLHTEEQFGYNFSRNSVGVYGRPSNERKRSTSINKKKLAKMLGEDEVGLILSPQANRLTLEDKPFYLNVDYGDDDIIINSDGSIKAGTLPALVERLTLHESMDPTFNSTFLMTYRSFATADEVLGLLIKRYQLQPPADLTPDQLTDWAERKQKPVKLRVFNILKTWLDQHYIETMDADILESIQEFATDIMAKDTQVRMPSQQLIKAVQRRQSDGDILLRRMTTTLTVAPPSIVPKVGAGKALQLSDINPIELARQMTLMEFELYNRIQPVDCLNKAWSKTDQPEAGANIKAMILTSNRIAGWIAEAILVHADAKKRAGVMKHLVQAAEHCRSIHNFSTMAAIMAGLNSTPVRRLQRTRTLLSTKTLALFDDLDKTLDSGKNFAGYRERLKRVDPPCIPFLGVYLTFLTFIEDGNADFLPAPSASAPVAATPSTSASTSSLRQQAQEPCPERSLAAGEPTTSGDKRLLIHFSKRQKAADVIREIQQYQTIPYALTALPAVQAFIRERLQAVENSPDLYEISLQLEPREREDEKIARMLRESGMI